MEMVALGLETKISECPKNIDLRNFQLIKLDRYPYILEPGDYPKARESVSLFVSYALAEIPVLCFYKHFLLNTNSWCY